MTKDIQSKKFFTSDHHFYHSNIIEFESRPFKGVIEMGEHMIRVWNETVSPEDSVYILGDFSFAGVTKTKEILDRLNGKKHLIWGNHDEWNRNRLSRIFDSVYDQAVLQLSRKIRVKLCHFPYDCAYEPDYKKYLNFRPGDDGDWLIHGHVHSMWKVRPEVRCINVGVDVWDYKPVSHEKIIAIIEEYRDKLAAP